MGTLWKKEWSDTDAQILAFTTGEDEELDNRLVPYDILGSLAHTHGLGKIGIISSAEQKKLIAALQDIYRDWREGKFQIAPGDEDVHTALENRLTAKLGETGKKIHTGRSRNDQVLTALRLYMKAALLNTMHELANLARTTCDKGEQLKTIPMPGYTHLQRAMPSSVAFWYGSFAEGFADTLELGQAVHGRLDSSPLGAAAGFGVPLPLDREFTASLMGFGRVQINAQAVQNSRGRLEAGLLNWLVELGRDVEKMAWDLLLYSSAEFNFVSLAESLCTGSSIMPQKKNADVLELLRATPSVIAGCRDEVERVIAKLPSSYHRDFQLTKPPLMRGLDRAFTMIIMASKALWGLNWNEGRLVAAMSQELFATDRALQLVSMGVSFREAYRQTAEELRNGETSNWEKDPLASSKTRTHLGSPGNPGLDHIRERVELFDSWVDDTQKRLQQRWNDLLQNGS